MRSLANAIRFLIATLMLVSGLLHVSNPYLFLQAIAGYELLPFPVAIELATFLPLLQLIIGTLLLCEIWTAAMLFVSSLLLAIFWLAGISVMVRELDIACGCFGILSPRITWSHNFFVLVLTGVAFLGQRIADARERDNYERTISRQTNRQVTQ